MELNFAESEAVKRLERNVQEARENLAESLDDGRIAARRLLRRGRHAVEDCIDRTSLDVRRHPVSFLAFAFAAGAAVGLLFPRIVKRK